MDKARIENAMAELCDRYCVWAYKPISEEVLYQQHCNRCPMNAITEEIEHASSNTES